MSATFKVEYSKSQHAKCKLPSCSVAIKQGELRLGRGTDSHSLYWYHFQCGMQAFERAKAKTVIPQSVEDLIGFDELKEEDKNTVKRSLEDMLQKRSAGKPQQRGGAKEKEQTEEEVQEEGSELAKSEAAVDESKKIAETLEKVEEKIEKSGKPVDIEVTETAGGETKVTMTIGGEEEKSQETHANSKKRKRSTEYEPPHVVTRSHSGSAPTTTEEPETKKQKAATVGAK